MKVVLDTSALLSGLGFEGEAYLPSSVLREARGRGIDARLESLLETRARVLEPREEELRRVRAAARESGDDARLSPVDHDVLALALQLEAQVVSDDYAIQNVASRLGLPHRPALLPGIREEIGWSFRCTGCGRFWPAHEAPCPVCGAPLKRVRRRA